MLHFSNPTICCAPGFFPILFVAFLVCEGVYYSRISSYEKSRECHKEYVSHILYPSQKNLESM